MNISDLGVQFIASFEGWSSVPYVDPGTGGEPITIGYGTTHYSDGTKVTLQDSPISTQDALAALSSHVDTIVAPYLNQTFTDLNQPQFDALCSFAYNIGTHGLDSSSLKQAILSGSDADTITTDFAKWNKGGGQVLAGLVRRRAAEANLFNNSIYN